MMGSTLPGSSVLDLSDVATNIFLSSGLAMILITITLGQLAAQVTASSCMLDFINNYFMLFSTYISLGIEFSGLLHCVYLVQIFFAKVTGTSIISNENPTSSLRRIFFWLRVGLSLTVLSSGPCNHCFHLQCVNKSLSSKKTCPICRAEWPT